MDFEPKKKEKRRVPNRGKMSLMAIFVIKKSPFYWVKPPNSYKLASTSAVRKSNKFLHVDLNLWAGYHYDFLP